MRLLRQTAARFSLGLADQAVSSLTNAAVSIYVAHTLGAVRFGAFTLAYVTYTLVLNASRGLATDPLVVRFSGTDIKTWRRAAARSTGTATAVGFAAGVCVLGVASVLSSTTRMAFLALGLTLPGLLLQDSWRSAFFALGRGSWALLNDTIWAVTLLPTLVILRITGHATVFWFVLAWGASGAVAASVGPLQARVIPRLSGVQAWVSDHRDLGLRYLAENTASSGGNQLRIYGLGLMLGLAAVGYVQASSLLMGPFLVVMMGVSQVTVPEAARVLRTSPHRLRLFCLVLGTCLAMLSIVWGATLLIVLPRGLGNWLLGSIWRPAYPLVLPSTLSVAAGCFVVGASAGLRALGCSRRSLQAQVAASAAVVAASMIGAYYKGPVGAVFGAAIALSFGAVLWWRQLRIALREAGIARVPTDRQQRGGRHRKHRADPSADINGG